MGRSGSLLSNIHCGKAAARERQQLARSGHLRFNIRRRKAATREQPQLGLSSHRSNSHWHKNLVTFSASKGQSSLELLSERLSTGMRVP